MALAVLDGLALDQVPAAAEIKPVGEAAAFRTVAFQPPLYAWLAALGMRLSADYDPLASVLPSYMAGVAVVILVYLHGRLWRGGGMGLSAAILIGFNPSLLLKMQEATPTTLALAGATASLYCYGWHQRSSADSVRPWPWAGPIFWAVAGGLSLGLSLLSIGRVRPDRDPRRDPPSTLPPGRRVSRPGTPTSGQAMVAGLVG